MGILDTLSSGPQAINTVSAFVIQEVTTGTGGLAGAAQSALAGVSSAKGRRLELQERGLPHRPFTLATSQRISMTWLPGYSVATAQALGAKEEQTTISGKWSDKYLAVSADSALDLGPIGNAFSAADKAIGAAGNAVGLGTSLGGTRNETVPVSWNGSRVETAAKAADYVDELVRGAVLVDVLWGPQARRGFITKFTKHWNNAHDLEWEMELSWISRAEPNPPVTVQELATGSTATLLQALVDKLGTEALPPTFPMAEDVLHDVDAGIKRIAATTQAIADTVTNVTTLALAPYAVARSLMALCDTVKGQVDTLINTLTALVPSGLRHHTSSTDAGTAAQSAARPASVKPEASSSSTDSMVAAEYVKRVTTAAKKVRTAVIGQKDEYAKKLERDVEAIVVAREGDDLRAISTRFYGSPNEWKRIASANSLTSAKLTAGLSLFIPKRTVGEGC